MKSELRRSLIVDGALAVAVAVILPLQTYLGNADIYPFGFWRLMPELVLLAGGICLGLLLVEKLLACVCRGLSPLPVFVATMVCVYLESGLLSAGLPELNGGYVRELARAGFGFVDAGVWAAVLLAGVVCARWLRPYLLWVSLAVLTLMVASLFDVRRAPASEGGVREATGGLVSGFENQPTVVANVKYSSTRNVLVFVLDSMPGVDAADLMRTNAALQAKFSGFTACSQNVCMHECTKRGMPGLVTGIHYDPEKTSGLEYQMTMYGTNSFVTAAVRSGWNVAFSPDLLPYGFTNLPVERQVVRVEERRTRDALAILRQSGEVPYLSLFDMTAFRLSPYCFKAPLLYSRIRHAVKGRHSSEGFWGEKTQYPQLAERPTSGDERPFLGVFHTWGAHPPWEGNLRAVIVRKLALLGELMDAYRAKGIYDRATIIVTADHGLDMATPVGGYPASASALLWVKPQGGRGDFKEDRRPTSHVGISALVRTSLTHQPSEAECLETLACEKAVYTAFQD